MHCLFAGHERTLLKRPQVPHIAIVRMHEEEITYHSAGPKFQGVNFAGGITEGGPEYNSTRVFLCALWSVHQESVSGLPVECTMLVLVVIRFLSRSTGALGHNGWRRLPSRESKWKCTMKNTNPSMDAGSEEQSTALPSRATAAAEPR